MAIQKNEIKLVIFDCDGVLVASEEISARVISEVIRPLGINISTEEAYKRFVGGSMKNIIDYTKEQLGALPAIDIEKEYRRRSFEAYRKELKPVEGILDIVPELKVKKCVGSNGPRSKILFNLQVTGLIEYFSEERIFSAYDIDKWKPAPDLYLYAADKMGVSPSQCLVIEDSLNGLKAARSAGMSVYGISHPLKPLPIEANWAKIFNTMQEVKNNLMGIGLI